MSENVQLTAEALEALDQLDPSLGSLEASSKLKKQLDPKQTRFVVGLHQLRQRAGLKLDDPEQLLLTKKGLEQATGRHVARYRATRIARWAQLTSPTPWIVDGTAGIGGDSLALLRAGTRQLVSNELDSLSASMLRANLMGLHPGARVIRSRIESGALTAEAILLDPDRRSVAGNSPGQEGARQGNPERWSPSWDACHQLIERFPNACIKLAPGVDSARLSIPKDRPRAWQWISMGGELKEATLWTGPWAQLQDPAPGFSLGSTGDERNVTVLARDGSLRAHWCAAPQRIQPLDLGEAQNVAWIAEPDPAVIRAGLVQALGAQQELKPLAEECVYLGGEREPTGGLLSGYRVLGHCALDKKRVRALLAEHDIGALVVKKRGHAASAEELSKRFGGKGNQRGLLIVARLGASHHAYLVTQCSRKK